MTSQGVNRAFTSETLNPYSVVQACSVKAWKLIGITQSHVSNGAVEHLLGVFLLTASRWSLGSLRLGRSDISICTGVQLNWGDLLPDELK